jgi:hypothetical protein
MKINVDRMAKLAGLSLKSSTRTRSLNEGAHSGHGSVEEMEEMEDTEDMKEMEEIFEMEEMEDTEDMEEIVEIDEVMLVQELRRAKKVMLESKRRSAKKDLQEAHLKKIIEEEVQNIFGEMNLNADWVYGSKKPKRSKQGYTHQGSFLKGIGFE